MRHLNRPRRPLPDAKWRDSVARGAMAARSQSAFWAGHKMCRSEDLTEYHSKTSYEATTETFFQVCNVTDALARRFSRRDN